MKKKKELYFFALVVIACVVFGFNANSHALYQNYSVSDERKLKIAVAVADHADEIVLTQDIYIKQDIKIESSVTLDLNGYSI